MVGGVRLGNKMIRMKFDADYFGGYFFANFLADGRVIQIGAHSQHLIKSLF